MRTSSSRRGRRAAIAAVAVVVTGTTLLTGCGSDSDNGSGGDAQGGGTITLRVGTFGSFGYDNKTGAKLYAEYEKSHPTSRSRRRTSPTARSTGTR